MNIVLIGFMGTGKTAVGSRLAAELGFQFMDTDAIIEKDVGMHISDIFARRGEEYFREAEEKVIALAGMLDHSVIATGGGVPLRDENMRQLERNGFVVCLTARPETIRARLGNDTSRPLLERPDPRGEIERLLAARAPYYARCRETIATDDETVEELAARVSAAFMRKSG